MTHYDRLVARYYTCVRQPLTVRGTAFTLHKKHPYHYGLILTYSESEYKNASVLTSIKPLSSRKVITHDAEWTLYYQKEFRLNKNVGFAFVA